IDIAAGEGTRLTLTTAAAEKVYRASGAAAKLSIALKAAAGAHLAWLPQETILFDRARIVRRIDIDLAEEASLLLCEIVVFGRAAPGWPCSAARPVSRCRGSGLTDWSKECPHESLSPRTGQALDLDGGHGGAPQAGAWRQAQPSGGDRHHLRLHRRGRGRGPH